MKAKNLLSVLFFLCLPFFNSAQSKADDSIVSRTEELKASDKLVILWTSGDKEVANKMVLMYTYNSKQFKWWDDITLIVWGPSQKLLVEDEELQDLVRKIMEQGTVVKACKGCADKYGISAELEGLGITVKYMGELTDFIKEGRHILTL